MMSVETPRNASNTARFISGTRSSRRKICPAAGPSVPWAGTGAGERGRGGRRPGSEAKRSDVGRRADASRRCNDEPASGGEDGRDLGARRSRATWSAEPTRAGGATMSRRGGGRADAAWERGGAGGRGGPGRRGAGGQRGAGEGGRGRAAHG